MVEPLRHRQPKGAATDMFYLQPPRHISTLPLSDLSECPLHVGFSNRPFWVKHFQAIHHWVLMSLAGWRFSSESALRPFHHGVRRRGGTIYWAALPSDEQQVQADIRTHLIHRPARDIIPPRGGARVSSYRIRSSRVFIPLLLPWSSGTRCRQPRYDA